MDICGERETRDERESEDRFVSQARVLLTSQHDWNVWRLCLARGVHGQTKRRLLTTNDIAKSMQLPCLKSLIILLQHDCLLSDLVEATFFRPLTFLRAFHRKAPG